MPSTCLRDQGCAIVAASLTELVTRDENPYVPINPDELAADAIECAEAGAAIVHFHARNPDGSQAKTNDSLYREALELIAKESDVLMWPTAMSLSASSDLSLKSGLPHVWALDDHPPAGGRFRIAPFDVFRKGASPRLDPITGRLATNHDIGEYDTWSPPEALQEMLDRKLIPLIHCADVGEVRWAYHVTREGIIPPPAFIQVQFFGAALLGPSPTIRNLDACFAEWGGGDVEWLVAAQMMPSEQSLDALYDHALERGAGIRVGLGDSGTLYPGLRNVDHVEMAVKRLEKFGLSPATPSQLLSRLEGN